MMHYTHLSHRTLVSLTGNDRLAFLQGIITNNVEKISANSLLYALLLTPNGRFLHDLFIFEYHDAWIIDCEKERASHLIKLLQRYKLRSNIHLEELTNWHVYASPTSQDYSQGSSFQDPRHTQLGTRLYINETLTDVVNSQEYEALRMSLGIPDGSRDMTPEKSIPLECNMKELNAIDWHKGCYMGQEFTARTNYLGQIRKRLLPIHSAHSNLHMNDIITQETEEVGIVQSALGSNGIALLRLSVFEKNIPIRCNNVEITSEIPEWLKYFI